MNRIFFLLCLGALAGCASPREAARIYNVQPQQAIVFCSEVDFETVLKAVKGGIVLNVPINVFADVQKKEESTATANISPQVDVAP
jgi:hypothetical protein